ncbi:MAG: helix-turn-helix transcriptional regulator [Polyangiaceae bacterium]|nr:helix-turn-helix transcriptional regulator [Polyangiaceae bacterium]
MPRTDPGERSAAGVVGGVRGAAAGLGALAATDGHRLFARREGQAHGARREGGLGSGHGFVGAAADDAVHFKSVARVAPLTYLTACRMRLAERALREDGPSIFELAASLGYASESALSHAFKRGTGDSPRTYRTTAR